MKTPARGRFRCPHCGAPRAYAYRRLRRFFVVLFVPLVPLRGEVEFVQCGFCRRAYSPAVLDEDGAPSGRDGRTDEETRRKVEEALSGAAASRLLLWESDGE